MILPPLVFLGQSNKMTDFFAFSDKMSNLLTLPLVAGTAGTFSTVIAAIGAIKLGAAAILLKLAVARGYQNSALDAGVGAASGYAAPEASYGAPEPSYGAPSSGYGAPKARGRRDVAYDTTPEGVFAVVSQLDLYSCGKSLVCELEAKHKSDLDDDEKLILTLFG